MNNQEAKFILGAYRSDGRDASDAVFAEALAQAERDPELRGWLERQRKFDGAVAARLQEIAPPAGLREAILAGARVSAPPAKRPAWKNPAWFALAAGIAVLLAVATSLKPGSSLPTAADLAAFARRDLVEAHDTHVGSAPGLAAVQAQLASARLPLSQNLQIDLEQLRREKCRAVRLGGREVFEVCFQRDGLWYHVYVGKRSDFAPGTLDPRALIASDGTMTSTAWADANHVYALVTTGSAEVLRRLI